MSDPGPLPVQQALDRIDALERTIIGMLARLDEIEGKPRSDWNRLHQLDLAMSRDGIGGA